MNSALKCKCFNVRNTLAKKKKCVSNSKFILVFLHISPYLATQNRPNYARKMFPCFDEPAFKVPFTVSISRPSNYTTLFGSPILSTEQS